MHNVSSLSPFLFQLGMWIYVFAFLIAGAESLPFIGLAIPGTTFIVLLGFLARQGAMNIWVLVVVTIIGAILGDSLSFYFGKRGTPFFMRHFQSERMKRHLAFGETFFEQHGGKSLLLGRFVGPLRPIVPFVAGLFDISTTRFFIWNICSAIGWAFGYIFLGYFFGGAWEYISIWSPKLGIFLFILLAILFVLWLIKWVVWSYGKQVAKVCLSLFNSAIQGMANNEYVVRKTKRHPRSILFWRARVDRSHLLGLPLTLFTLVFVYVFTAFVGVAEGVIHEENIINADVRLEHLLYAFRQPDMVKFFLWITVWGKWQMVAVVIVVVSIILFLYNKREYLIGFLVSTFGGVFSLSLMKVLVHRSRPIGVAVYHEASYSFPSGHATLAIALFGMIFYMTGRLSRQWRTKTNLFFIAVIFIFLLGFSRLYLGVHYLSDVWGGYLLGFLWLFVGVSIIEWGGLKQWLHKVYHARMTQKSRVWFSGILIGCGILFYVGFGIQFKPIVQANKLTVVPPIVVTGNILNQFGGTYGLPQYTETLGGRKQEPLSFIIIALNKVAFIHALQQAGWTLADAPTIQTLWITGRDAVFNQEYSAAPMTPDFWNTDVHAFGFEKATARQTVRQRHHARFWTTNLIMPNGNHVYVGTASMDRGIKWGITHRIVPAIDTERDFLFNDLQTSHMIITSTKENFVPPVLGKNFTGDPFFTDGQIYVVRVK